MIATIKIIRERNKPQDKKVIHNRVVHHLLTDAQLVPIYVLVKTTIFTNTKYYQTL